MDRDSIDYSATSPINSNKAADDVELSKLKEAVFKSFVRGLVIKLVVLKLTGYCVIDFAMKDTILISRPTSLTNIL